MMLMLLMQWSSSNSNSIVSLSRLSVYTAWRLKATSSSRVRPFAGYVATFTPPAAHFAREARQGVFVASQEPTILLYQNSSSSRHSSSCSGCAVVWVAVARLTSKENFYSRESETCKWP